MSDKPRCEWGNSTPEYIKYHDAEWGVPLRGDNALFERLTLEAFQSGLSWLTILRKRENFRAAFAGFEIDKVAAFDESDREHGWPPLKLSGGRNAMCVPPAETRDGKVTCPVGWPRN